MTSPPNAPSSGADPGLETRRVENEIAIQSPLDAVWRALTEAEELTRWFPLEARVTPGEGGAIWLRWDDDYDEEARIEIWKPESHLRISFPVHGKLHLATDYYLRGRGGETVLRVVTSGFGEGTDWNDLYEGVERGWIFELGGLRHYLERHRGSDRLVAWVRRPYRSAASQVWDRLTGSGGWLGRAGLRSLAPGERYEVQTRAGDRLEGRVVAWRPPRMFVATVDNWNDALLRLELETRASGPEVSLWMSAYNVAPEDLRAAERSWMDSLGRFLLEPA